MGNLIIQNNNITKVYECKTTHTGQPYLQVNKNNYLDLTTNTTSGLHLEVKKDNKIYRPIQTIDTTITRTSSLTSIIGYSGYATQTMSITDTSSSPFTSDTATRDYSADSSYTKSILRASVGVYSGSRISQAFSTPKVIPKIVSSKTTFSGSMSARTQTSASVSTSNTSLSSTESVSTTTTYRTTATVSSAVYNSSITSPTLATHQALISISNGNLLYMGPRSLQLGIYNSSTADPLLSMSSSIAQMTIRNAGTITAKFSVTSTNIIRISYELSTKGAGLSFGLGENSMSATISLTQMTGTWRRSQTIYESYRSTEPMSGTKYTLGKTYITVTTTRGSAYTTTTEG